MRRLALIAACLSGLLAGCVTVKEPLVDLRSEPAPVDTSRIPPTSTHQECRAELERAYQRLQYLERENERLSKKAAEYKRERDRYKDERDDYRERLEKDD